MISIITRPTRIFLHPHPPGFLFSAHSITSGFRISRLEVIPEVAIETIKARISAGDASGKIAQDLDVSKTFVNKVRNSMPADTPRPQSGAPLELTAQDRQYAVSLIKRGRTNTAVEATKIVNERPVKPVCVETVRRALKDVGNLVAKKKKKPALNATHRCNRLRWAIEHRHWTVEDWKSVIWSDETKINRLCSDGLQYA